MVNTNDSYDYKPPVPCKELGKLFALQRPYFGKRINKSRFIRKLNIVDIKQSRKLSAAAIPIPTSWSWKELGEKDPKYKGKIERARDQGGCGSCWSFATAMSLGDRYAIKYNIPSPYPSPTWLLTSTAALMETTSSQVCENGGDVYYAGKWLEKNYIKTELCWPYAIVSRRCRDPSVECLVPNPLPKDCCANCCDPTNVNTKRQKDIKFTVSKNSTINLVVPYSNGSVNKTATIAAIQRDIMKNGPAICSFQLYDDFMDYWETITENRNKYKSFKDVGIYVYNKSLQNNNSQGGHAVTITGWGTGTLPNGKTVRYWEMRNSWGTREAYDGYCKVAFTTDAPDNKILQVDIPKEFGDNDWMGGMLSILPGDLPKALVPVTEPPLTTRKPIAKNENEIMIEETTFAPVIEETTTFEPVIEEPTTQSPITPTIQQQNSTEVSSESNKIPVWIIVVGVIVAIIVVLLIIGAIYSGDPFFMVSLLTRS